MPTLTAIDHLSAAAVDLAQIHRGKHFAQWREDARYRLGAALSITAPFDAWAETWIFTGDGGRVAVSGRFGDWAIDRLVEHLSPEEIVERFEREVARNTAIYAEVSPVFGVQIDEVCDLNDGVTLEPAPVGVFESFTRDLWPFDVEAPPEGTSFLRQTFAVTPAFARSEADCLAPEWTGLTHPDRTARETMRTQVRLACLLASAGPVELPLTTLRPDRSALFVAGEGDHAQRPVQSRPRVNFPVRAGEVKAAYDALSKFQEPDAMARAINRLGRSRIAAGDVDRAMELGMAAEIALMHGASSTNTEITHKIASRAAWLIAEDVEARLRVFDGIKRLYHARSTAVHSGVLSARASVDLTASDHLVSRVLLAIATHGCFPDWNRLTLGGGVGQNASN